ncbi:MAG TPA: DNA polymerase I [Acidimicrobiaceae bacterium]|nr:DNA polymerase I [Acidimicrobiaceae bacterium]
MAKLLLLDGNSLTYRAWFAIPEEMSNSAGESTNAVFGFSAMLATLLRDQRPDGIAVCFDRPEPTFRHERKPSYKAQRDRAPDDLIRQMAVVRRLLAALAVPAVDFAGFEADDLLATLAARAEANGDDVVVVTGDRDAFQLPRDPHVRVLYTLRGVTEYALLDEAGVAERVGVAPGLYPQYAALRGDTSDNLPGVPGVGEKRAAQLLERHHDLDGIFAALDSLTPKLRENLAASEELVRENLELMVLRSDVPLDPADLDVAKMRWRQSDVEELAALFAELEFRDMHARLVEAAEGTAAEGLLGTPADAAAAGAGAPATRELAATATVAKSPAAAAKELAKIAAAAAGTSGGRVAVGWTAAADGSLSALGMVSETDAESAAGSVLCLDAAVLADGAVAAALGELLAPSSTGSGAGSGSGSGFDVHDAKALAGALAGTPAGALTGEPAGSGIGLAGLRTDTRIAAYLADPAQGKSAPAELLPRYCGLTLPDAAEPAQESLGIEAAEADAAAPDAVPGATAEQALAAQALAEQTLAVAFLAPALDRRLAELGMTSLYADIERPLVGVLARMEARGVGVDRAELTAFARDLGVEAVALAEATTAAAGREFNVASPKELATVLFDELGLTSGRRTQRGGYSTDATTLEAIRAEHEIVDLVLSYREISKLQSTCEKSLIGGIEPDGRIHATFHQTVSRTGRLSSEGPNLHGIPVRGEHGHRVRRAFVPTAGFELLVADYDQIELRVVAHLSGDPALTAMFASGEDVHRSTAAAVFGVAAGDVTADMRNKAKMVSYGLMYGMEAFGLGQRLRIETAEAAEIRNAYIAAFGAVDAFMTDVVAESRERGYTETMFGRRRPIPELNARNHQVRRAAERQAMNAPVQGLAADIFKIALVRLDAALAVERAASTLVLQVHDEVILEVAPDERDDVLALTVATMTDAVELSVPLEVAAGIGSTWADAKA